MKFKLGIVVIILGVLLVAVAGVLFFRNQQEQRQAARAVEQVMPQMVEVIHQRQETVPQEEETTPEGDPLKQPLPVVQIDGYGYIGFVGIPALELELPVMADWSYPQMKLSPCRFSGDTNTDDLVIMAHNYEYHFGNIKDLKAGDTVTFTSMDGKITYYQVVAKDVLESTDVENMTAGEYDLTLFTCTYGGNSRVTVRCDLV